MIIAFIVSYIQAWRELLSANRAKRLIDEAWEAGSVFMDAFGKGINDRAVIKARKKAMADIGTD